MSKVDLQIKKKKKKIASGFALIYQPFDKILILMETPEITDNLNVSKPDFQKSWKIKY